ncbi:MAG: ATP-dependent DNA helicase RecG [Candidatus Omnitrophica bacterium]|nr:ATP-dependent DNA helicase RecG [Candidatus Omnitrophota bacterium]
MVTRQAVVNVDQRSVQYVKGVGPARAALLANLGVRTVLDALLTAPRRYEDRGRMLAIRELEPDQPATIRARVLAKTLRRLPGGRTMISAKLADETGALEAVWFNQPYLANQFEVGEELIVYGRREAGRRAQMIHPEIERLDSDFNEAQLHIGRIVPIYPLTQGLGQRWLRRTVHRVLTEYVDAVTEPLPDDLRQRLELPGISWGIQQLHFPDTLEAIAIARRRLAFDELFVMQLRLALRRHALATRRKPQRYQLSGGLLDRLTQNLPYRLTAGQQAALQELLGDLAEPAPMLRLLQGDVGCGKTIVAVHLLAVAMQSGYQAAVMVPTELLAEQQYRVLASHFAPLGVRARLLTHGAGQAGRAQIVREIAEGAIQLVVGTHALLEADLAFRHLALVVIDEQHKFGVAQRVALVRKGGCPDVLVMTATPIPRTLALSTYGDLQSSTITQLPPGRQPIRTRVLDESGREEAYRQLETELRRGRQGYVVYPVIDADQRRELKSATQMAEHLARRFAPFAVRLLHGQMPSKEKEALMQAFVAGQIALLVCTVIVEVGLDVPNATIMVIEHAECFGLAQLHQLRGRIGRGTHPATCVALAGRADPLAQARLAAFAKISDGFRLAERDLELRGPGELLGRHQHGWLPFRVADLARDLELLELARQEAFRLVAVDPKLADPKLAALRRRLRPTARPG